MKTRISAKRLITIAIGAALVAVCSWISIPFTIPFTLQTFAVCLIAALLGTVDGLLSLCIYLALGIVGIPVFSGFRGGIAVLLGTTGGYIIGFFFTMLIVGLSVRHFGRKFPVLIISMAIGILVCYAFGTAWFMILYTQKTGPIGLVTALGWCVFPYLLPDAAKIILAAFLVNRIYPVLAKQQ